MIYDRIKELCVKNGISIYRLEKALNFSSCSICKWKNSTPSIDKIQKIAEFFNVPISYFLESEEENHERSNDSTGNSITN